MHYRINLDHLQFCHLIVIIKTLCFSDSKQRFQRTHNEIFIIFLYFLHLNLIDFIDSLTLTFVLFNETPFLNFF